MRNPIEFQAAAVRKRITRWHIRNCILCEYECGFLFNPGSPVVNYDSGCYCVSYRKIGLRTWSDVADHYNMQTNPETIKSYDDFWGFN